MSVTAIRDYVFPAKDTQAAFHGNQVVYAGWDEHLMFCSAFAFALPPETRFGDFVEKTLTRAIADHPDTAKIDWKAVTWLKSGQLWSPDFEKSLSENGLRHKELLRFKTPGLNGIGGLGI